MDTLTQFFAEESAGSCADVLDFWLYECSLDQAPNAAQVAQWRDLFQARGGAFGRLAETCRQWLAETGEPPC